MLLLISVCNFIVHEKCLKTVTLPCYSVAATLVKNPVAHVWTERTLIKGRKFCNVCRKKLEDVMGICCEGELPINRIISPGFIISDAMYDTMIVA